MPYGHARRKRVNDRPTNCLQIDEVNCQCQYFQISAGKKILSLYIFIKSIAIRCKGYAYPLHEVMRNLYTSCITFTRVFPFLLMIGLPIICRLMRLIASVWCSLPTTLPTGPFLRTSGPSRCQSQMSCAGCASLPRQQIPMKLFYVISAREATTKIVFRLGVFVCCIGHLTIGIC